MIKKSILFGTLGMIGLLGFYFVVLTLVSGQQFALQQFDDNWYYVLALSAGFGIQIGLYTYLRRAVRYQDSTGKIVAVSGTTSTLAMISCCSHYLVNILPIIGIAGLVSLVSQYQIQLFWFGLASNLLGIFYLFNKTQNLPR